MVIIVEISSSDKTLFESLHGEGPPGEDVRAKFRRLKPKSCILCDGDVLHGNGWRNRTVLKSWSDWETVVWYWRVECQSCGAVHCLMPEIVIPDLLYAAEVVAEVVVGLVAGKPTTEFAPHRRTQKRWLDRFFEWWSVAQSSGAIRGAITEWCVSVSGLLEAIKRCAESHVGLFFPSRYERAKTGASPRRSYPAIATHQMSSSIQGDVLWFPESRFEEPIFEGGRPP